MPDSAVQLSIREVGTDEGYRLIAPLLQRHYEEIGKFKDIWEVDPELEAYQVMEAKGRLLALVAFLDNEVVGYSITFLAFNLHYKGTMIAQNDLLYVVPERRGSSLGLRLMRETITHAKQRGAKLMQWHSKLDTSLNTLLPKLGYEVLDVIWAKII